MLSLLGYDSDSEEEDEWNNYQGNVEVCVTTDKESADSIWKSKFTENLNGDTNVLANLHSADNMYEAISSGNVDIVRKLLQDGTSCDEPLSVSFGSSGRRPIFVASEEGSVEIVELLLDYGCRLERVKKES